MAMHGPFLPSQGCGSQQVFLRDYLLQSSHAGDGADLKPQKGVLRTLGERGASS